MSYSIFYGNGIQSAESVHKHGRLDTNFKVKVICPSCDRVMAFRDAKLVACQNAACADFESQLVGSLEDFALEHTRMEDRMKVVTPEAHPNIKFDVTFGMRGYFVVMTEDGEPLQSGCGSHNNFRDALPEAIDWAEAEGYPLEAERLREVLRNIS